MKIKIVSGGHPYNTQVFNADTGELLENVMGVKWKLSKNAEGHWGVETTVTLKSVPVELAGECKQ